MEETTLKWASIIVPCVVLVFQSVLAWASWSMNKKFVPSEECAKCREEMSGRVAKAETTLTCLDSRLERLPSESDIRALSAKLSELGGKIDTLSARIDGQEQVMERVERPLNLLMEHHLRGAS
ncbi:hypothetical protein JCM15519_38630 [Fundidesulfovibrio butyratiphilus]